MLSRILQLQDLLNNPDNFGFLITERSMPLLKILDFRLAYDAYISLGSDNFGGFLVGNGFYNYIGYHRIMRYELYDRLTEERVKAALNVLTVGPLSRFHECVDLAHEEFCKYITTQIFSDHVPGMLERLELFRATLHHNITFFTNSLLFWKSEESNSASIGYLEFTDT